MDDEMLTRKLACPYKKGQSVESFHKPLKLARQNYFSASKQSYPDFEEIRRSQATVVKK